MKIKTYLSPKHPVMQVALSIITTYILCVFYHIQEPIIIAKAMITCLGPSVVFSLLVHFLFTSDTNFHSSLSAAVSGTVVVSIIGTVMALFPAYLVGGCKLDLAGKPSLYQSIGLAAGIGVVFFINVILGISHLVKDYKEMPASH